MADIEQVSEALAQVITGLINAKGEPPCGVSVVTGWPAPNDLDAAMKAKRAIVSVFPPPGASAVTTRGQWDWYAVPGSAVVTTTATIDGGAITFGGTITLPLNVALTNKGRTVVYEAKSGDTLQAIAAGLAQLYGPPASAGAGILMLPDYASDLRVTFGTKGKVIRENAREKPVFQITVWAPTQPFRTALCRAFEPELIGTDGLPLPDGQTASIFYMRQMVSDHQERQGVYRRDLWFQVDYAITETDDAWQVVSAAVQLQN